MSTDFALDSYNYPLPEENIAQHPAERRDGSRLLVLDKKSGETTVSTFSELLSFLPENPLLVVNNSRVIPARLFGTKPTGGRVEYLQLTPVPLLEISTEGDWNIAQAKGLLRASKTPKADITITFSDSFHCITKTAGEFGQWNVELRWQGDLTTHFNELGHLPLPPYIKRPDSSADAERYQTTYANPDKAGSVAAPTAGLHFTPELRQSMEDAGVEWAEVTLYVGYGTFSPIRAKDIRFHEMHPEYIEISQATADAINKAKTEGRPVIAVGTTSARSLEGMFREVAGVEAFAGETDIFIMPGYQFNVIDGLLTNFHLPESSLVVMVSALAGRENVLSAYQTALDNDFRFFSYGDAMFIY